ncbi:olfactory receptor 14I1-like [Xiphophorus couchianus]|uniref:olfactory receptor 14I1-like n=1 Tax=Xiphophorus couchianus TaxID=32473 RepID=UPI0010171768|nr:olfactory receptor 14I1-like [Xiphophorus couchianus]
MPNFTGMQAAGAPNISSQCLWSTQNQTDRLAAAGHLFHSIIPRGPAVPALICVFAFLTLFSLLVNLFTLYTIERSGDFSYLPRFILCKSLIFSDLLQTVTFAPAIIDSLARRQTMAFNPYCYFQHVVGGATIFSSLTTITCMALERYLFVCYALQYTVTVTRERVSKVLVLVWLYSAAIGVVSLSLVLSKGRQENVPDVTVGLLCEPDIMEQHVGSPRAPAIFRKVAGSLALLLCLLAHAFSYFRMYRNASNAVVPFNESNAAARRTVLFYCGMLFLQLLPLLIKVTSDALWEFKGTGVIEMSAGSREDCLAGPSATAAGFHVSLLVMLLVPPCINPLVYGLRSVELRKALVKLLRWRVGHRGDQERPRGMMRLRNVVHPNLPDAG